MQVFVAQDDNHMIGQARCALLQWPLAIRVVLQGLPLLPYSARTFLGTYDLKTMKLAGRLSTLEKLASFLGG
jgi:hypothetical protein